MSREDGAEDSGDEEYVEVSWCCVVEMNKLSLTVLVLSCNSLKIALFHLIYIYIYTC